MLPLDTRFLGRFPKVSQHPSGKAVTLGSCGFLSGEPSQTQGRREAAKPPTPLKRGALTANPQQLNQSVRRPKPMAGYILVLAVLILGGAIATLGDRLGTKVGKARLSLFNLQIGRAHV